MQGIVVYNSLVTMYDQGNLAVEKWPSTISDPCIRQTGNKEEDFSGFSAVLDLDSTDTRQVKKVCGWSPLNFMTMKPFPQPFSQHNYCRLHVQL